MTINVKAIQDMLRSQVRKGRTPVEAAGEGRWLAETQQEQGLLSRETRDEEVKAINEWLAAEVGASSQESELYGLVAGLYASFIGARVHFGPGEDPIAALEGAWQEWRRTTRG